MRLGQEIQEVLRRGGLILTMVLAAAACQPRPAEPPVAGPGGTLMLPSLSGEPTLNDQLRAEAERVRDEQERQIIHKQLRAAPP